MLCAFILLAFVATSMCHPEFVYDSSSGSASFSSYSIPIEERNPCYYRAKVYYHGSQWRPYPCAKCECVNGDSYCDFYTCPELVCDGERLEHPKQCCPTCENAVISETPVNYCYWKEKFYEDGQSFTLNECTDCFCKEGIGSCVVRSCPPLPESCTKPKVVEGECCPVCPEDKGEWLVF